MLVDQQWTLARQPGCLRGARHRPRGGVTTGIVLLALLSGRVPLAGQGMEGGTAIPRRTLTAGVTFTHESWDRYWEGTLRRENENIGTLTTRSLALVAGYGVTDRLSLTAVLPYVRTGASRGTLRGMQGVQDVQVAARYTVLSTPAAGGRLTASVGAALGLPVGSYSPDFLPLSIGLGSRRISGRLGVGFQAAGWSLDATAAYTVRGTVKLDREAYYTDGELHLGDRVAMPDVFDCTLGAAYRAGRLHLPVGVTAQRTLGGGDIRRQDMPFVSNRMDFVRIDGGVGYTLPAARLTLRLGAGHVLRGRNVGQATTFTSGVTYTLPF